MLWLLRTDDLQAIRKNLNVTLESAILKRALLREAKWTESVAVGSAGFVRDLEARIRNRQVTEITEEPNIWVLREGYEPEYGRIYWSRKSSQLCRRNPLTCFEVK